MFDDFLHLFRLIRVRNVLIIMLTQVFAYYFLSDAVAPADLLQVRFLLLLLATGLVAAAGYIINDYMDVKLDLVNKPDEVIVGRHISRRGAMFFHWLFNSSALLFSAFISWRVATLVLFCTVALWLYSQFLKKMYLAGNLLVSAMTASTIIILLPFDERMSMAGSMVYAFFAFTGTLIREIIKDTEDMQGDLKFNCKTLPIVIGVRKTRMVLMSLQVFFLAIIAGFLLFFPGMSKTGEFRYFTFLVYMGVALFVPNVYMLFLISRADVKRDFTHLSSLSKLLMVTGILSMIFWKS